MKSKTKKMKGIEVTATMLATIIMVVIVVIVLLLLYGSFAAEAGNPVSNIFFKLMDWIVLLVS